MGKSNVYNLYLSTAICRPEDTDFCFRSHLNEALVLSTDSSTLLGYNPWIDISKQRPSSFDLSDILYMYVILFLCPGLSHSAHSLLSPAHPRMHSLIHLILRLIHRFLSTKNRLARRSYQLWSALWALVRRQFPLSRPPSGGLEQTEREGSESIKVIIPPVTAEQPHTAVICTSNVPHSPVSSSHPNLPSVISRPLLSTNTQRPASYVSPSAHSPAPGPYITDNASISHLGIRASNMSARSADNLSLASHRLSIIQADARRTSRGLSKRPSGISSRAAQRFFTGDRAPPSSSLSRSSPAPSRAPSRAPARAPSRAGSFLRPSSWAMSEYGRQSPSVDESVIDVHVEVPSEPSSPSSPSSPTVASGSKHQAPSVAGSRRSSVADIHVERPSKASSTLRSSMELSLPEPPAGRIRKPIATCHILRYDRDYKIPTENTLDEIPPLTIVWPHSSTDDCGMWTPVTHPEGVLYFYDSERHISTDIYMYDPTQRVEVEACVDHLNDLVRARNQPLPPNHELVLDMNLDGDDLIWGYYYVDHDTRSLFWLEEYPCQNLTYEVNGVRSLAHVKHAIDDQYWTHWSYYPIGPYTFPKEACQELLGVLIHNATDTVTSNSSTAPYDLDRLFQMITLVKKSDIDGPGYACVVFSVARLMSFFSHWRFLHHHGQRGARLDRDKSVHGNERRRTILITLLSPLLFWAPEAHLCDIEKLWVDEILNHATWKNFVSKLQTEWTEFVAYASILLTANVAFLAIPAVTPQDGTPAISPAQISSNLSVASSVGSIILGLLLIRQNRSKTRADAGEAANFLWNRSQSKMGLEPLAIIHSLPYALLMWAMVTYLVAFAIFCFWDTNLRTRIPVGAASLAVLSLILWCILSAGNTSAQASRPWFHGISLSLARRKQQLHDFGERLRHRDEKHISAAMELPGRLATSYAGSTANSFMGGGSVNHVV